MSFAEAVSYNRGRGAADGNNYWRRYAAAHWIYVSAATALWGAVLGAVAYAAAAPEGPAAALRSPALLALNAAPAALFALAALFAFGRAWPAALLTAAAVFPAAAEGSASIPAAFASASRSLVSGEAPALALAAAALAWTAFALLLARGKLRPWPARVFGTLGALAALAALLFLACGGEGTGPVLVLASRLRGAAKALL